MDLTRLRTGRLPSVQARLKFLDQEKADEYVIILFHTDSHLLINKRPISYWWNHKDALIILKFCYERMLSHVPFNFREPLGRNYYEWKEVCKSFLEH